MTVPERRRSSSRTFNWPHLAPLWTEEGTHKGRPYPRFFVYLHKNSRLRN